MKKLTVIIPVYNEEQTIATVIRRVQEANIGDLEREIIVVDDCSSDGTRGILSDTPDVTIIHHEHNIGKGGAIKTGKDLSSGRILFGAAP